MMDPCLLLGRHSIERPDPYSDLPIHISMSSALPNTRSHRPVLSLLRWSCTSLFISALSSSHPGMPSCLATSEYACSRLSLLVAGIQIIEQLLCLALVR